MAVQEATVVHEGNCAMKSLKRFEVFLGWDMNWEQRARSMIEPE